MSKSFKAARAQQRIEPFTVDWTAEDGSDHTEEFKAHLPAPSMLLVDVMNMQIDLNMKAFRDLYQYVLGDDYQRFHNFLSSPEHLIDAEVLGEITQWIMEESAGRPTTPSAHS